MRCLNGKRKKVKGGGSTIRALRLAQRKVTHLHQTIRAQHIRATGLLASAEWPAYALVQHGGGLVGLSPSRRHGGPMGRSP
jgi:hypothetical protein